MNATHQSPGAPTDASAGALIGRLFDDATSLLRNELALAKAEILSAAQDMKVAALSLAAGAAVVVAGALTLVAAAVLGLATIVEPWLAALIVGLGLTLIGVVLLTTARRKIKGPSTLEKTRSSLDRDASVVARRTP
jgi:xanthine/uracil permease